MPAGRFHWGEVLESFLGQPPLAGFPVLVDGSGAQRGGTGNLRCSPEPAPAKAGGLKNAIAAVFAGASWQRCRTHFMANLLTRVPKRAQPGLATMVRTIYQQLSPAEVHGQLDRVVEQLREPFAQVAELLADAAPDILACTAFPVAHWQKLWSNNPQERLNREIRRRTDVVGIFPNRPSARRLVGAVLAEQHDEWAEARRYLTIPNAAGNEALPTPNMLDAAA